MSIEIEDVIEGAIRELDLAAKVELLTGAAAFALRGNEVIGLRPMIFSDGPTGVRGSEFVGDRVNDVHLTNEKKTAAQSRKRGAK